MCVYSTKKNVCTTNDTNMVSILWWYGGCWEGCGRRGWSALTIVGVKDLGALVLKCSQVCSWTLIERKWNGSPIYREGSK